ncbi:zinc finger protein ZIPIC-like [Ochlerotatus camptorhynchus]|uniref:zinc finger protein ZIPIC-like n=1 Tax=Ochlerotatus camptorhynchus TaxID=644619 RepID=UPI0031DA98C4
METRRCKKSKSPTNVRLSFVEVKQEPDDGLYDCTELLQPQGAQKFTPETVNKHSSALQPKASEQKSCKTYYRRSRATQVNAEDIDVISVRSLDLSNVQAENKPIQPIGPEAIIPQCRFCLRRVSRANMKIILMKHKTKALAAFQIRVFPNDAYPFACSNCLNLIDIFLDFKSSVTKARNLLLNKRMHLESNGWDDAICIEAFNQCKTAVEQHRMQIDAIYDEQIAREERRNASIFEPKMELNVDEQEKAHSNDLNFDHEQSTETTDNMIDDPAVEFRLESDINEVEQMLISHAVDGNGDNESELITTLNVDVNSEGPAENEKNAKIASSIDEDYLPLSKRRKVKVLKYSTESEQGLEDEDYTVTDLNSSDDDDYKPESLTATSKKSKTSSDSEQETDDEISIPEELDYGNKGKPTRSSKAKAKGKKPRKPRKKRESTLNRPPDYKPPSILPVLCDLCGEKVRPETIEGHRNRHLGIKPYTCPVDCCGWTFYGRANMSTHMRRMHPENGVPSQKCDVCGKYIRGKPGILNEHKKLHFLKEKSYVCPVCGKGFTLNRYLRQHSIIHTGLFPYECSYCGKKFNNKWSMKTHEKNMHEKKNQASASYDSDPIIDAAASGHNYAE